MKKLIYMAGYAVLGPLALALGFIVMVAMMMPGIMFATHYGFDEMTKPLWGIGSAMIFVFMIVGYAEGAQKS